MNELECSEELECRKAPGQWLMSAQRLRRAAEILFNHAEALYPDGEPVNLEDHQLGLQAPAMLLLGYGVELGIKGCLLQKKIKEWEEITKGVLGNHELVAQFDLTGLPRTPQRTWLLKQLTEHVLWAGRYPLPVKAEKFKLMEAEFSPSGKSAKLPPMPFSSTEQREAYTLIEEILAAAEVA